MVEPKKTHREAKSPQINARYLADYMAGSERARRTIVRSCKYQPIARVIQHDEAKLAVSKYIRGAITDLADLTAAAADLRGRMADTDFDRDLLDHNADYIDRFVAMVGNLSIPDADTLPAGKSHPLELHKVKVTPDIQFRLRRLTKTNKIRLGAGMLRYAKGKPLSPEVAKWQSAFLFGYLQATNSEISAGADIEGKLCLTIDAWTGQAYGAPTDAASRFKNMEAACATIAERWANIEPPAGAIL
jgi:hypothetical protein